jgi:hypothetical protein
METHPGSADDVDLGDDLLSGASEIAQYLFKDRKKRRKIYHLNDQGLLPLFYMGGIICGRKSTLKNHIVARERAAAAE